MKLLSRLRLLLIALLPLALATACISGPPTVPPSTALVQAAAETATALALLKVTPATALPSAPPAGSPTGQPPADTAVPAVTATAAEPSATPSPLPPAASATPAGPATPDPNEAVGDIIFQDALDGTGRWFWNYSDEVAVFGVDAERGQLKGTMLKTGAGWRFTSSDDTQSFGAQQVRVTTHTTACADNDEYGLIFWGRHDADYHYDLYLFTLRCSGAARFAVIQDTQVTVLTDWTASPAIHTGAPADNTLMVWMAGGEFRFYVNDQYLFSAQDTTLTSGFYGLYLNDRTAGGATVFYEDLIARAVNR